jgi:acyl-CoA oxidase
MRETSDVMQELAQVYGERHTMEYCISVLAKIKNADSHQLMTKVFRLFGADCINRELSFYVIQGVISQKAIDGIIPTRHGLIKDIALRVTDLMDCMSIPKHALYAPIAANYMKYNEFPNQGEVINAKM